MSINFHVNIEVKCLLLVLMVEFMRPIYELLFRNCANNMKFSILRKHLKKAYSQFNFLILMIQSQLRGAATALGII